MANESRKQLLADIRSMRAKNELSDLVITCGEDKYCVHKVIVCCRSTVFAKALEFPGKEAEEKCIDLSDNEPAIVKLLIQYLYEAEFDPALPSPEMETENNIPPQDTPHTCSRKDKYQCSKASRYRQVCPHHYCGSQCDFDCSEFSCGECSSSAVDGAGHLLVFAKMYEMADKYDVAGLKDLCVEKYKRACLKFWDDPKFAQSAYHVYCTTPSRDKGLRNIVCKTLSDHMSLLEKPEIEDLMTEFNGLAFGLLFDKAKQSGWCDK
ncbi:uncharacterized protein EKO05_0001087 [Ascochyta rabiei]|uniref:Uncharacterized protein n=1 Tax=Didymella rabiei TaxID=5454 RepID=A0A163D1K9_DIDRA|nr:uncharacterized protein EKO05_0001087 [Ascochyta rabiei]KZM22844.1 hypothetical protein ST47_g6012 [Ascochyta rabiei]UPX10426.1 hypothetical protein EKO05_0001087 [Ascochyta rabiei]